MYNQTNDPMQFHVKRKFKHILRELSNAKSSLRKILSQKNK